LKIFSIFQNIHLEALPTTDVHPDLNGRLSEQRWKSHRTKIHRHGYQFSIDFLIHTLGYGFFGNHKHLAKVSRLLVPKFLKFIGLYGFFYGFYLFLMCFIYVLFIVITNLKFYKLSFIKDDLQKHFCIIGRCLVHQRNQYAKPYGFKNL
jgi:hypothetical protein